ncbi:MAG: hypothetical protein M1827_002614 [Pycnora praestabilis]|nr:MAG: hypothetical protein M1827_002614 [Pycnora praestabilis]
MADRFPSLEDFSAGQTETNGDTNFNIGSGTTSHFLDREKAALGDDANQFSSPNDASATVEDGDDDLLGGGDGMTGGNIDGDGMDDFQSSFPAIDSSNEVRGHTEPIHMAPGGTITGSTAPFLPGQPQSSYGAYAQEEEEPEVIKQWRERRDLGLQHRDEVSSGRKEETVKAAQSAIDDFYENYNTKKDKTITQTRKEAEEFLANREDTSAGGTSWERIAKLVDISGKGARGGANGTGKERFRELLVSLRKDEKAPGATGY